MEIARTLLTDEETATEKVTSHVLVRFRGYDTVELHFMESLTEAPDTSSVPVTRDYRRSEAPEVTQPNVAEAYRLLRSLNDLIKLGLETASASYRKVTLTFGEVFLDARTLRDEVERGLTAAIKQYAGSDTDILWRR